MLSAIVMAAGKGTRMNSNHAKTMHKVLDKPMIGHINDTLDSLSVNRKVFVVGYDGDSIRNYLKDSCQYATQEELLGTAHAVMQASQLKDEEGKTLIINGDCPLIQKETYQKMLDASEEYPLVLLTVKLEDPAHYGRIVRDDNGDVQAIVERKDCSKEQIEINEINVGIYCVDNQLLWKYIYEIDNNNKQHEYYITDLVKVFKKHGHKVTAVVSDDKDEMQGINSPSELASANKWLQNKINSQHMANGVVLVDPQNTYIGPDVKIGQDTTIYPNVRIEGKSVIGNDNIIEEGTVIINATIGNGNKIISSRVTDSQLDNNISLGPNSHLRNNCHIYDNCRIGNFVEMKNVEFGTGSKCAHLTYVGDATVGEKCNFGCGVVTVNYDGKNKFRTTIGNHVFIGSNVNLIAPVTIADNTVLAAGSTITDDVAEGDMAIARSRQQNKKGYGEKYLNKQH